MRIFVLEDDPIFKKILKRDLEEAHHDVLTWDYIDGASEQIRMGHFDLLIVDMDLPSRKGAEGDTCKDGGLKILEGLIGNSLPPSLFITSSDVTNHRVPVFGPRSHFSLAS